MSEEYKIPTNTLKRLKIFADFIFFDEFQDKASYPTFEKCMSPFFKDDGLLMDLVFKDICGKKKKYITFPRILQCYFRYKKNDPELRSNTKKFMKKLLSEVIKFPEEILLPEKTKNSLIFTSLLSKNRSFVSEMTIYTNKDKVIRGLRIQYDDLVKAKLFDQDSEVLYHDTPMTLDAIPSDDKKNLEQVNLKNEFLLRDAITHVFGTYTNKIEFLGFKSKCGKYYYEGVPNGKPFIFGYPEKQFQSCRFHLDKDTKKGITNFQLLFIDNPRVNQCLKVAKNQLNDEYFKEVLINEEKDLQNKAEGEDLDKCILSLPVVEDTEFAPEEIKNLADNPENDLAVVANKEEKQFQLNKRNQEEIIDRAECLELKDIINGSSDRPKMLRGAKKKRSSLKLRSKKKKKFIPKKMKNLGKQFQKNNYESLMERMKKNIGKNLDKEKERLKLQLNNIEKTNPNLLRSRKPKKKKNTSVNGAFSFDVSSFVTKQIKNRHHQVPSETGLVESFFDRVKEGTRDDYLNALEMSNDNIIKMFYGNNTYDPMDKFMPVVLDNNPTDVKPDKEADRRVQNNFKKLSAKLPSLNIVKYIKTISAVKQAVKALEEEKKGESELTIGEKIRLLQILQDNEKLLKVISKSRSEEEVDNVSEEEEELEEEEIPGLEDVEGFDMNDVNVYIQKIREIKKTTNNNNILKKLNKMLERCLEKKNELLQEDEKQNRSKMIKDYSIDEKSIVEKEKKKRMEAQKQGNNNLRNLLRSSKRNKLRGARKYNTGIGGGNKITNKQLLNQLGRPVGTPEHSYRDQKLPKSGTFTDELFPAEENSLCEYKRGEFILPPNGIPEDIEGFETYTWARAKEIIKNDFEVFEKDDDDDDDTNLTIEDDDIIQGTLGDCYFLSAIAALAKEPVLIKRLFETQSYQKTGAYGVYYNINGEWKMVVVDDLFPCIKSKLRKKFVFSNTNGNEIWVILLEKAWAKINGNFARIGCGGLPHEVFEVTTDAYSEMISIPDSSSSTYDEEIEELWQKLVRAQNAKYIMTAGTGCTDEHDEYGLSTGHAYTLTHVYDLFPGTRKNVRLVNLRNPWGNGEWTGDYCDGSEMWENTAITKELNRLKREYYKNEDTDLDFEENDDGEFFMTFEDFVQYIIIYNKL